MFDKKQLDILNQELDSSRIKQEKREIYPYLT